MLSFLGLFLLSFNDKFNFVFGFGELLVLGAAIAFALHIVNVSRFAPHVDPINLTIVQLALVSLLSFIAMPIAREPFIMPPLIVWVSVLFMGIVDVAFTLSAMMWVQQIVSGTRAALFGIVLVGDRLSLLAWIGCGLILTGMIVGSVNKIRLLPVNQGKL